MAENVRLEELLQPSLDSTQPAKPIFSSTASFLVAFLGGAFAILIFSGENLRRLDRLSRDAWLLGILTIAVAWLSVVMGMWMAADQAPAWLSSLGEGSRGIRRVSQLIALLIFSLFYYRNRPFHRAQEMAGQADPNPWPTALVALGVGVVLSYGCMLIGGWLAGGLG